MAARSKAETEEATRELGARRRARTRRGATARARVNNDSRERAMEMRARQVPKSARGSRYGEREEKYSALCAHANPEIRVRRLAWV